MLHFCVRLGIDVKLPDLLPDGWFIRLGQKGGWVGRYLVR
jgi:hypothetical protein